MAFFPYWPPQAVHSFVEAVERACTATDRDTFRQALDTIDDVPTLSGAAALKSRPRWREPVGRGRRERRAGHVS